MDNDAVLPSSPPHATALDPPSSPFFFEPQQQYGAFSPKSSSPAPIFSSDDSREEVDVTNYRSPRVRKAKRKGAWYETDRAESSQALKKTRIARNYDSGIYMMSDVSANSEDILPEHKAPFSFVDDEYDVEPPRLMSVAETSFYSRMREGLENDSQSYDFTNMSLQDDDIKSIGDLNSIINNPPDPGNELPVESQYRSMDPVLYVNLGSNNLFRLTSSLFNLEHLTTLTLRNNAIEELPPQITQLRNLESLDVSLNKLRHLPFEIIHLIQGRLRRINTHGNPLAMPELPRGSLDVRQYSGRSSRDPHWDESFFLERLYQDVESSASSSSIWRLRFLEAFTNSKQGIGNSFNHHPEPDTSSVFSSPRCMARTLVSYKNHLGTTMEGSPALVPESSTEDFPIIFETNRGAYGVPDLPLYSPPSFSRVTPLTTRCITVALQHDTLEETVGKLGGDLPYDMAAVLDRAAENNALGCGYFQECPACKKDYIVPRAEWIEFWAVEGYIVLPLRVKVCSWGCVPSAMSKQPEQIWECSE